MAGKKRMDPISEAAEQVVEAEQQRGEIAKREQGEREQRIAECHEAIGRFQGFQLLEKFGDVTRLVWLKDVKDSKVYKDLPNVGTWDKFCEYLGLDRHTVDQNLLNLATFGEDFLVTATKMRVGYREMRKLRQLSHDGAVTIDAEFMVIGEERIPLDGEHKEELQAAIETLVEQQAAMQQEFEAQKKAFDRVQADTHKSVTRYGAAAITCITVQNSLGVTESVPLEAGLVVRQVQAVLTDSSYLILYLICSPLLRSFRHHCRNF